MAGDELVPDVAAAILDGTAVDWDTAESNAGEQERTLLGPLRRLARLADFHRGLPPTGAICGCWKSSVAVPTRGLPRVGHAA